MFHFYHIKIILEKAVLTKLRDSLRGTPREKSPGPRMNRACAVGAKAIYSHGLLLAGGIDTDEQRIASAFSVTILVKH